MEHSAYRAVAAAVLAGAATGVGGAEPLRIVDNPELGAFADIAAVGVPLSLGEDGEMLLEGTFEGNFVFSPGLVLVGQNGGVQFGAMTVTDLAPENQPIPSSDAFAGGQAALVYWDDIDDKEGEVLVAELVNDPVLGDRLVVQWSFPDFDGNGSLLELQAQITDNVEPAGIYAQYAYRIDGPAAAAGGSATIGYQDGQAGFNDVQFSFNAPGAVSGGSVLSLVIAARGDLNADGYVDSTDFFLLLAAWGPCGNCVACPADLDGDCTVGALDFLLFLGAWG